jgi:hypothetical protein
MNREKMKVLMVVGPARVNVLLSSTIKGYIYYVKNPFLIATAYAKS